MTTLDENIQKWIERNALVSLEVLASEALRRNGRYGRSQAHAKNDCIADQIFTERMGWTSLPSVDRCTVCEGKGILAELNTLCRACAGDGCFCTACGKSFYTGDVDPITGRYVFERYGLIARQEHHGFCGEAASS